jgi:hypothetical protein
MNEFAEFLEDWCNENESAIFLPCIIRTIPAITMIPTVASFMVVKSTNTRDTRVTLLRLITVTDTGV